MAFQIVYVFQAVDRFTKVARKIEKSVNSINRKIHVGTKSFKKFGTTGATSFKKVGAATNRTIPKIHNFKNKIRQSTFAMRRMSSAANSLKSRFLSFGSAAFMASLGLRQIINRGKQSEKAFLNLAALTGITGKDLEFLREKAHQFARVFGMEAKEIFVAFKRIAGLKPELIKDVEALSELTKQALILDAPINQLERTSRTLAVALNIYGKGAESAAGFTEILAASARLGSAEVNEVGLSFLKTGSVMELSNISFKEGIALIQTLARSGLLKQAAGTGLSTVLLRLQRAGFEKRAAKGSHRKWRHPSGVVIMISGKGGGDAKPYQENAVEEALEKAGA